jgi:hypothetical protein
MTGVTAWLHVSLAKEFPDALGLSGLSHGEGCEPSEHKV